MSAIFNRNQQMIQSSLAHLHQIKENTAFCLTVCMGHQSEEAIRRNDQLQTIHKRSCLLNSLLEPSSKQFIGYENINIVCCEVKKTARQFDSIRRQPILSQLMLESHDYLPKTALELVTNST